LITPTGFDDKRESLPKLAAFWILQAIWVWTVSLPLTILNASEKNPAIGASDVVGWCIFVFGLVIETVADIQKTIDKKRGNHLWTKLGLWSWSRRPNYFGEIVTWIGGFVAAARVFKGGEWAAIISPIFITLLLLFVSGIPLNEASYDKKYATGDTREDYLAFKNRTSILIPLPPTLYEKFPKFIKRSLLLDLPFYNHFEPKPHQPAAKSGDEGPPNETTPLGENKM
jgi:steroid 5-alpha reductase family enzyme